MRDRGFRKIVNPELLERLKAAALAHLDRSDHQEPTFRCPTCCETRFTTRTDSHGRVYGARCDCLLDEIANAPKVKALEFRSRERDRPIDDDEGLPF